MDIKCLGGAGLGLDLVVSTIRAQGLGVHCVPEVGVKNVIAQGSFLLAVRDRKDNFHATIQVAFHHVRTAKVNLIVTTVGKIIHAAVFKEAPNDAADADRLTPARNAGPETADAADDQVDINTGN